MHFFALHENQQLLARTPNTDIRVCTHLSLGTASIEKQQWHEKEKSELDNIAICKLSTALKHKKV